MKKVLILTSSPHAAGNSNAMASAFEEAAKSKGAEVTRVDMNAVPGSGCCACMACRRTALKCVIKDKVGELLVAFRDADVLVMAAPVWWLDVPVSLRRFVERWYSFLDASFTSRLPAGKTVVLLLSQGADDMSFIDLPDRYKEMAGFLGVTDFHAIRHCSSEENPIRESGVLEAVAKVARAVV
jgi:multimeric flavodoxin WrbA